MAGKQKKSNIGGFLLFLILLCLVVLIVTYKVFAPNTGSMTKGTYLYIHTGANYTDVSNALKDGEFLSDETSFGYLAKLADLPKHIHAGKYLIKKGMSNYDIFRLLRSGKQISVKLVINKVRTKNDLINLISSNLECDSVAVDELLHNTKYLSGYGLDSNTVLCAFVPDTYDFFWNTTAEKAFSKIAKNYNKFWDNTKKEKAKSKGLSQTQAIVVASIVEEETNEPDDKPLIASVYINRFRKGMKLQADPTVKYAIGDFSIKRVTGVMLGYSSPYNTYKNEGLPPGPICTPSLSSINAVLDAPETKYLYFCAKSDFSGHSAFAVTFEEQKKNAKAYQKALNEKGIH